jgi:excisionase family DNA binding protein
VIALPPTAYMARRQIPEQPAQPSRGTAHGVFVLSREELESAVERAVRRVVAHGPDPSDASEVLTREQAAELLQVNPHTIPRLVRAGLPAHRLGAQWRFRRSELLAYLARSR